MEVKIRGLKWREKKALAEMGIDLTQLDKVGPEQLDEIVEVVLQKVYPSLQIEDLTVGQVYEIFRKTMEATFPQEAEIKNS